MAEQSYRIEHDSMGEVRVPADALYGAQTQRAVENFPVSGLRFPRAFLRALGMIKGAAAAANQDLGLLEPEMSRVVELAGAIRALGAPKAGDEAFSPRDAATEAATILALHAEQRERGVVIDASATSPLRTQRWMFVRALIALGASTSGAPVTIKDDGDAVLVVADGRAQSSAYARELATAMGAASLTGPRAGFRIPTLAAIRQREGR